MLQELEEEERNQAQLREQGLDLLLTPKLANDPLHKALMRRLIGFNESYKKFLEGIQGEPVGFLSGQEKARRERMHERKLLHECLTKLLLSVVRAANDEQ